MAGGGVRIYYCSVRGLRSKLSELELLAEGPVRYDIIAFTEPWLDDTFNNAILPTVIKNNYQIYRSDRAQDSHGGVVFVSYLYPSIEIMLGPLVHIEATAFKICSPNPLNFCFVYRPPGTSQNCLPELKKLFKNFTETRSRLFLWYSPYSATVPLAPPKNTRF